jgi:hypothetical protein
MVSIVNAIYGGYDSPKVHVEQTLDVEFLMLTDCQDDRHPRLAAKEPKLRPWDYVSDGGPWIWMDGSFEITSSTFVAEILDATEGHPISQWEHPQRDDIYAEAVVSAPMPKYRDQPIDDQADHYAAIGHPAHWGLWATGLIVYRERCEYLSALWWAEMNRWGFQDQISQPVALRAAGMRPHSLPYNLYQNPWLRLHGHRSEL